MIRKDDGKKTHLRPMHPRGPVENGWLASLTSFDSGSSHLSGLNLFGSLKFDGSCAMVQTLV